MDKKYIVPVEFEVTAEGAEDAMQKMRDALQAGIDALAPGKYTEAQAIASAYYGEPYPGELAA